MNKYEDYFKQFEQQFGITLNENIKNTFISTLEDKHTIVSGRSIGKTILTHLLTLYDFYKTNSLDTVVKLCDYFYIVKARRKEDKKTDVYYVVSKGSSIVIAELKWWPHWRKYCFFPYEDTLYDNKCMLHIMNFLNEINLAKYKDKEDK